MRSGKSYSGIFRRRTKDGRLITVKGFIQPIFDDDGSPMKIIEISVEIDDVMEYHQEE